MDLHSLSESVSELLEYGRKTYSNCGLGVTFEFKKKRTLENRMLATHSPKETTAHNVLSHMDPITNFLKLKHCEKKVTVRMK